MTGLGVGFWSCGRQDGYRAGSLIPAILLIAALLTRAGAVAACERSAAQFRYPDEPQLRGGRARLTFRFQAHATGAHHLAGRHDHQLHRPAPSPSPDSRHDLETAVGDTLPARPPQCEQK